MSTGESIVVYDDNTVSYIPIDEYDNLDFNSSYELQLIDENSIETK